MDQDIEMDIIRESDVFNAALSTPRIDLFRPMLMPLAASVTMDINPPRNASVSVVNLPVVADD